MRTIIFRGFRKDGGGWIYGDLIHKGYDGKKFFEVGIKPDRNYPEEVYPESVGQYLNEKDVNGRDIYENDIIVHPLGNNELYIIEWYEEEKRICLVEYCGGKKISYRHLISHQRFSQISIVGNSFEHKHLLETK